MDDAGRERPQIRHGDAFGHRLALQWIAHLVADHKLQVKEFANLGMEWPCDVWSAGKSWEGWQRFTKMFWPQSEPEAINDLCKELIETTVKTPPREIEAAMVIEIGERFKKSNEQDLFIYDAVAFGLGDIDLTGATKDCWSAAGVYGGALSAWAEKVPDLIWAFNILVRCHEAGEADTDRSGMQYGNHYHLYVECALGCLLNRMDKAEAEAKEA